MSYEQIKDLRLADFKRYCGVEPETFQCMVEAVSKRLIKGRRKHPGGALPQSQEAVLVTLQPDRRAVQL